MTYAAPVKHESLAIQNQEDASVLMARLESSMEGLVELIEAETKLLRDGKLFATAELESKKNDYAKAYVDLMKSAQEQERILKRLIPEQIEKLSFRHEEFKSLLQINLTALAAARDVTRGLIGGVARQMGQTQAPATYGAHGRMTSTQHLNAPGITTDKNL